MVSSKTSRFIYNKPEPKPFGEHTDLFDLDTFEGRYAHFGKIIDVRNLFYSNKNIKQFQKNIDEHTATGKSEFTDEELWKQKYIIDSNLHPETKEPISVPFRWSSYVPMNVPCLIGMAMLAPTTFNQGAFQSLNQAYNFGLNRSNSSATNSLTVVEKFESFYMAVGSAVIVSVGFKKFLELFKSKNMVIRG